MREDRSVVDLLNADYTFVNERLARHYGIPGVHGSQFRRVTLPDDTRRGLLGQGSILLVTSVANRTSPVARGKWVLENILGTPRRCLRPMCRRSPRDAGCHESRFGARADGGASQESGLRRLPQDHGPDRILAREFRSDRKMASHRRRRSDRCHRANWWTEPNWMVRRACGRRCLSRSDVFVPTLTEKLLTYAIGRGLEVLRHAGGALDHARRRAAMTTVFRRIVLGIVKSEPFQMKMKPPKSPAACESRGGTSHDVHHQKASCPAARCCAAWASRWRLPLLDSMVPAQTPLAQNRGESQEPAELHLRAARRDDGQVDARQPRARASSSPKSSGRSKSSATAFWWSPTSRIRRRAAWAAMPAPTTRAPPRCF